MIPISQFLTPVAPVAKTDYSGLSDLGDFINKRNQFGETLDENKRQADQSAEIARQKNADTTRYYDMQAETHRMDVQDRGEARRERNQQLADKRVAQLRDALRKAQTPNEKHMILEQIAQETGGTIEEAPQAAVDAATAVADGQKPDGQIGFTPGDKPQKVSPNISKATSKALTPEARRSVSAGIPGLNLDAFMASQADPSTQGPAPAASDVGAMAEPSPGQSPASSPFPWEQFGMPAPKPELPASQPSGSTGSGRFILKDKNGKVQQIWDEGAEAARNRAVIHNALAPYIDANNPEMSAAAERAATAGADVAVGHKDGVKAGIEYAKSQFQHEMGAFKKEGRPSRVGTGTGSGGPSKAEMKLSEYENKAVNDIISRVKTTYHVNAAVDSENEALQGLKLLDMDSGTGDYGALAGMMRSFSGKAVSDKERAAFTGSEGFWSEMLTRGNKYLHGGRYDPEFIAELRKELGLIVERAHEAKTSASKVAAGEARGSRLSPSAVDVVTGHFTGEFAEPPPEPLRRPAGASSAATSTPKTAAPKAPASSGKARLKALLESGGE